MTDWRGDPLEILIRREGRTCKGCVHMQNVFSTLRCLKGKKMSHRCKHYRDTATEPKQMAEKKGTT